MRFIIYLHLALAVLVTVVKMDWYDPVPVVKAAPVEPTEPFQVSALKSRWFWVNSERKRIQFEEPKNWGRKSFYSEHLKEIETELAAFNVCVIQAPQVEWVKCSND